MRYLTDAEVESLKRSNGDHSDAIRLLDELRYFCAESLLPRVKAEPEFLMSEGMVWVQLIGEINGLLGERPRDEGEEE